MCPAELDALVTSVTTACFHQNLKLHWAVVHTVLLHAVENVLYVVLMMWVYSSLFLINLCICGLVRMFWIKKEEKILKS